MAWPTPLDYQEAVQDPCLAFRHPRLQGSHPAVNNLGLPKVASGNFACVFQLQNGCEKSAVRCFLRVVTDQQRRYSLLSQHLGGLSLPTLVGFEYLVDGIGVRGQRFPIVKMEWVEGETLDVFVERRVNDSAALRRLAAQWRGLVAGLQGARMAHGDLQHGNVLVDRSGWMRLVDYDAMFIPALSGEMSPELGHPNYQHPHRSAGHYDRGIDNFAAVVIYLSFLALAADPTLWRDFHNGDNLILTKADYTEPRRSRCLDRLRANSDPAVRQLATRLEQFCSDSIARSPDLEAVLQGLKVAAISSRKVVTRYSVSTAPPKPPVRVARPSKQTVKCRHCGHENTKDLIYCENCAARLRKALSTCAKCKSRVPAGATFCRVCGSRQ